MLEWTARENRIILTHDRATMPAFAYERVLAGQAMSGVFVVSDRVGIGQAIEEILLIDDCTQQEEWSSRVAFVPL